jgi:hypothetical protein
VGGCGVAGEGTDTPELEFELGAATVTAAVALVVVLPTVWVWAAGDDATAITPDSDVAVAALPLLTGSELIDSGFCAAGRMICGYCTKGNNFLNKIDSGTHSDPKFGQRRGGVSYIDARKKGF